MTSTAMVLEALAIDSALEMVSLLSRRGALTRAEMSSALHRSGDEVDALVSRLAAAGVVSCDGERVTVRRGRLADLRHELEMVTVPGMGSSDHLTAHDIVSVRPAQFAPHDLIDV